MRSIIFANSLTTGHLCTNCPTAKPAPPSAVQSCCKNKLKARSCSIMLWPNGHAVHGVNFHTTNNTILCVWKKIALGTVTYILDFLVNTG